VGFTSAQLAGRLGINKATANRWRSGKSKPTGEHADIFDRWEVRGDLWYEKNNSQINTGE
jgi:transcriptional regulator with XRE-family HTH domain